MDQDSIDTILDAAARLFAEHGYDGVGIREIARSCGTPPPSIYYHFKSKQELYREAAAKKYEEAFERIAQAILPHNNPNKRIEALVTTLFDLFLEDRILFLLMQRDIIDSAVMRSRSMMKTYYEQNLSILEQLLSEAVGKPVDHKAVFAVASLVVGYCELSTITDGMVSAKENSWYQERRSFLCELVSQSTLLSLINCAAAPQHK